MTHSHKRPKSRFEWFRMDVPARHRATVGKTSWQHSLETTDPALAAIRRSQHSSHYKSEVLRLDTELAKQASIDADVVVGRALKAMIAHCGSMDNVIASQLSLLALNVRSSWGAEHAAGVAEHLGLGDEPWTRTGTGEPIPCIDDDADRTGFALRAQLIEGRGIADGIVNQELPSRLLERRAFDEIWFNITYLSYHVTETFTRRTARFDAIAEAFLRRLADHQFENWPEGIAHALAPLARAETNLASAFHQVAAMPLASPFVGEGHALSDVFAAWRAKTKATVKTQDEFSSFIDRFIALFGDMKVEAITKAIVIDYRNVLEGLPARVKKEVAALQLRDQVRIAEERGLPRLAPPTVEKGLQALRTALRHARHELLYIENSPADGVTVDKSDVQEDERLAFDGHQLKTLFSLPFMTNPTSGDETMSWFFLLAPFTGCRIEEIAQLRPGNVRQEDGIWFIAIERDRKLKRLEIAASGKVQKRTKTRTSLRNIPLHRVLIKAGFLDLVKRQSDAGADWIFDDLREYERYDQRAKYMSNKIMRVIRAAGIKDSEYVYHSFRHSLKGKLRDDERTKEEISDLLTGHSFAVSVGRKYARGAGLRILKNTLNRVSYNSVDWERVTAASKLRLMAN